jgi:hypothetical protein
VQWEEVNNYSYINSDRQECAEGGNEWGAWAPAAAAAARLDYLNAVASGVDVLLMTGIVEPPLCFCCCCRVDDLNAVAPMLHAVHGAHCRSCCCCCQLDYLNAVASDVDVLHLTGIVEPPLCFCCCCRVDDLNAVASMLTCCT